jgi:hypothetical protein
VLQLLRPHRGSVNALLSVTTSCTFRCDDPIILKSKQKLTKVAGWSNAGFSLLCLRCDDDRA